VTKFSFYYQCCWFESSWYWIWRWLVKFCKRWISWCKCTVFLFCSFFL